MSKRWVTHLDSQVDKHSRKRESSETVAEPHLDELTIMAKLGNTDSIMTNVYTHNKLLHRRLLSFPGQTPSDWVHTTRHGTQARQIQGTPYWRIWSLAQAPNDTTYKRWSCHSGYKLYRNLPPPVMEPRFTVFGQEWRVQKDNAVFKKMFQTTIV